MATIFQERVEIQWKGRSLMGLLDWLFGKDDDDTPDDLDDISEDIFDDDPNVRQAEDGTIFVDSTSGRDTVIIHPDGDWYVGRNDKDD
jgi:hypothetical protein